jgi:hypothetical protein
LKAENIIYKSLKTALKTVLPYCESVSLQAKKSGSDASFNRWQFAVGPT